MKIRLDKLIVDNGLASTLKEAHGYIGAGQVYVNDTLSDKPGNKHDVSSTVHIKGQKRYVSRGGLKLARGLDSFEINIKEMVCIDVGASSGGFTDCLLQHGAKHVYAVDVAYGQFSWKLRQDKRVTVIERFNARNLSKKEIPEPVDLIVIDASFISLTKLLPPLLTLFGGTKRFIALIKPQFELPRDKVTSGGVVKDHLLHQQAVIKIKEYANALGLKTIGVVDSPIYGPKGNKEFVIYLSGS